MTLASMRSHSRRHAAIPMIVKKHVPRAVASRSVREQLLAKSIMIRCRIGPEEGARGTVQCKSPVISIASLSSVLDHVSHQVFSSSREICPGSLKKRVQCSTSALCIENVLKYRLCPALRMVSRSQLIAALSNGINKDRVWAIRIRHKIREINSLLEVLIIGRVTQCKHPQSVDPKQP